MSQATVLNFQDFIAVDGEMLTTTSMQVAAVHGKRHDNVVQLIRKRLLVAGPWGLLNFKESSYANAQGKMQPMFEMTRDGYAFIVGKLSGKLAAQHQIAFIEAFNAMAAYIKNQRDGLRYRCMEKELECKDSARRGSFHGRGLNVRKQEKPVLESELSALMAQAQPSLHLN
jgi:Rha family phage regulatory protein